MPVMKVKPKDDWVLIPDGETLKAKIKSIEERTIEWVDKSTGEDKSAQMIDWKFEVTQDGDYKGERVKGGTFADSRETTEFVEVLLGREIDSDLVVDTDDFVGREVYVVISHRPDKRDPEKVWAEVREIMPLNAGGGGEVPF